MPEQLLTRLQENPDLDRDGVVTFLRYWRQQLTGVVLVLPDGRTRAAAAVLAAVAQTAQRKLLGPQRQCVNGARPDYRCFWRYWCSLYASFFTLPAGVSVVSRGEQTLCMVLSMLLGDRADGRVADVVDKAGLKNAIDELAAVAPLIWSLPMPAVVWMANCCN